MNLNTALRAYNSKLSPVGIHAKKLRNGEFILGYVGNGKGSYIIVGHNSKTRVARLAKGYSHPNHRGLRIGTALRAYALWILYMTGYQKVVHAGINKEYQTNESKNFPISTHIVRKHLGFEKHNEPGHPKEPNTPKANHLFYRSAWTPTPAKLKAVMKTMRISLKRLQDMKQKGQHNLRFNGNLSNIIHNNNK